MRYNDQSGCFLFNLEAEVDTDTNGNIKVSESEKEIKIKLNATGKGTLYNFVLEAYSKRGSRSQDKCDFRWSDERRWRHNYTIKKDSISSSSDEEYILKIRKPSSCLPGLQFSITISFEHEGNHHTHEILIPAETE